MAFLSTILFLISGLILIFFWWRVKLFLSRGPNIVAEYIGKMALLSAIGMEIFAFMCFLFPENSFLLGLFNILGETFYLIAFVYGFALFIHLISPETSQRKLLAIGFLILIFVTISHFIFFPRPFIDENGVLHFNAPTIPGLTYTIISIAGLLPLTIAFMYQAIKKPFLRTRSLFLGTALLVIIIAGALLSLFTKASVYIFAFLFQTFGFVLLLVTAIYRPKKETL